MISMKDCLFYLIFLCHVTGAWPSVVSLTSRGEEQQAPVILFDILERLVDTADHVRDGEGYTQITLSVKAVISLGDYRQISRRREPLHKLSHRVKREGENTHTFTAYDSLTPMAQNGRSSVQVTSVTISRDAGTTRPQVKDSPSTKRKPRSSAAAITLVIIVTVILKLIGVTLFCKHVIVRYNKKKSERRKREALERLQRSQDELMQTYIAASKVLMKKKLKVLGELHPAPAMQYTQEEDNPSRQVSPDGSHSGAFLKESRAEVWRSLDGLIRLSDQLDDHEAGIQVSSHHHPRKPSLPTQSSRQLWLTDEHWLVASLDRTNSSGKGMEDTPTPRRYSYSRPKSPFSAPMASVSRGADSIPLVGMPCQYDVKDEVRGSRRHSLAVIYESVLHRPSPKAGVNTSARLLNGGSSKKCQSLSQDLPSERVYVAGNYGTMEEAEEEKLEEEYDDEFLPSTSNSKGFKALKKRWAKRRFRDSTVFFKPRRQSIPMTFIRHKSHQPIPHCELGTDVSLGQFEGHMRQAGLPTDDRELHTSNDGLRSVINNPMLSLPQASLTRKRNSAPHLLGVPPRTSLPRYDICT